MTLIKSSVPTVTGRAPGDVIKHRQIVVKFFTAHCLASVRSAMKSSVNSPSLSLSKLIRSKYRLP